MDPLELLANLEGVREKIPAVLRQDFEDLITNIRNTYEMSIKYITPPEPVHDGRRNLAAHHSTLDGLCTQLESSLGAFQLVYMGAGSDAYHTRAAASLQDLKTMREHLAQAAVSHTTMATNFDTATEAKVALAALLVGLGITLGVLIASAGTTAPVTVPAAAVEIAGGAVSIGLMTEAEAAAAAAIMGLIWAALPEALLMGLEGFAAAEVVGHIALQPPGSTRSFANSTGIVYNNPEPTRPQSDAIKRLMDELGSGVKEEWIKYLITLLGTGKLTIEQSENIIRCLHARGWLQPVPTRQWNPDYATAWNIVTDNIEPDDIQAAWKDLRGIPVIDQTGKVWPSHLKKVSDAVRALERLLTDKPGQPALSKGFKDAIRKLIQGVNDKVFGDQDPVDWTDQARLPFWQDIIKNSGCLQSVTGSNELPK